jgi:acyl-coenzyme A synthetase/AMP-(fatty) acid ligase
MALFLHSEGKDYTYTELVEHVNQHQSYFPICQTKDLYDYFVNFIVAIASNQPLTLVDADSGQNDLPELDFCQVNMPVAINLCHYASIDDLVNAVLNSTSKITIFTSGTTGQPKKVVHTISTLTRAVRKGERYINQVWAYAYNPTHMAGLQVFFQIFANQGILIDVFNQSRDVVYQMIDRYAITHISATPTFYRLLLPFERIYESVVRVTLGGEKSDMHLYEAIHSIFPNAKINNVYASTEAGSLFAAKDDCFQIPIDIRNKFQVKDDELLIHKSLLGESNSFTFDDEFYHSGDLIEWVNKEDGLFRFKSRKNELINVGGYKVNPTEVEGVINSLDGVQQAIVYGRSNSVLGNIVVAEVQLALDSELTDIEIRQQLIERLQDFKIPRKIKIVESLMLTKTGKLKR